jgi:hypothetical protein
MNKGRVSAPASLIEMWSGMAAHGTERRLTLGVLCLVQTILWKVRQFAQQWKRNIFSIRFCSAANANESTDTASEYPNTPSETLHSGNKRNMLTSNSHIEPLTKACNDSDLTE